MIVLLHFGDPPVVVRRFGSDAIGADSHAGSEENLPNTCCSGFFHVRAPGDGVPIAGNLRIATFIGDKMIIAVTCGSESITQEVGRRGIFILSRGVVKRIKGPAFIVWIACETVVDVTDRNLPEDHLLARGFRECFYNQQVVVPVICIPEPGAGGRIIGGAVLSPGIQSIFVDGNEFCAVAQYSCVHVVFSDEFCFTGNRRPSSVDPQCVGEVANALPADRGFNTGRCPEIELPAKFDICLVATDGVVNGID